MAMDSSPGESSASMIDAADVGTMDAVVEELYEVMR